MTAMSIFMSSAPQVKMLPPGSQLPTTHPGRCPWASVALVCTLRGMTNDLRPPSAWSFCALKCLLFKEGGERDRLLNKVPIQTALLKEGGNLHSLTKTELGATGLLSCVSPEPRGRTGRSCQGSLQWPTAGFSLLPEKGVLRASASGRG